VSVVSGEQTGNLAHSAMINTNVDSSAFDHVYGSDLG
jgi:hypothetical protein